MSAFYTDFCAECDRLVRRTPMGWYRCDCCGYESLRTPELTSLATPPAVLHDLRETRGPQARAGLVSLTHKVEIL